MQASWKMLCSVARCLWIIIFNIIINIIITRLNFLFTFLFTYYYKLKNGNWSMLWGQIRCCSVWLVNSWNIQVTDELARLFVCFLYSLYLCVFVCLECNVVFCLFLFRFKCYFFFVLYITLTLIYNENFLWL